jgi:prepilin peptidase CpaA
MLPLQWSVAIGVSLVAAVIDVRSRRIPNRLTGPLALAGLLWATCVSGLAGLGDAALGCLLLSFPFVVLFLFAGGGAGDAKLMGALGTWLGVVNGSLALAAVCLAGVFLAVVCALAKKQLLATLARVASLAQSFLMFVLTRGAHRENPSLALGTREMQTVPYAVAIFIGVSIAGGGVWICCA